MFKIIEKVRGKKNQIPSLRKLLWSRRRNVFYFIGYVSDIIPQREIIVNGMGTLVRTIIVKGSRDKINHKSMYSALALTIPNDFTFGKIEPLRKNKVLTSFVFKTRVATWNGTYVNFAQCVAIRPIDDAKLWKECVQIHHHSKENRERPQVDKDGYKYPYDY